MQERWIQSSGGVRLQVLGPAADFANAGHDVRRPDRGQFQDVVRRIQERL